MKTKISFLCKFTLISRMETGRANKTHIRKSQKLEMKKISKACSRYDLELGQIFPVLV